LEAETFRKSIKNNQQATQRLQLWPSIGNQTAGRSKVEAKMGIPFDFAPERPEHIDAILNGLDRYNPETTQVFQDYVTEQCESKTYDCYANLALLKL